MNTTEPRTTCYTDRATATRQRRKAKGMYATRLELDTYRKTIARGGDANLTAADIAILAKCRWLPASQQRKYIEMAASVNWQ